MIEKKYCNLLLWYFLFLFYYSFKYMIDEKSWYLNTISFGIGTVVILCYVISLCSLTNYDQMGAENKVHLIHIWKSVSKSEQSVLVSWGIMGSTRPGQRVCFTRPGYLLSLGAKCQAHPSSLSLPLVHPNFFEAANNFSMSFS